MQRLGRHPSSNVEGGGCGQLVVSAADGTWRAILCWASAGRRIDVDHEGTPASLVNLQVRAGTDTPSPSFRQLSIASFRHRFVRYEPLTAFGMSWQERFPGACLAILLADTWRDCQVDVLTRARRRFGFRDVDPVTGSFLTSTGGGRPKEGVTRVTPNALDGGTISATSFRFYSNAMWAWASLMRGFRENKQYSP